MDDLEITYPYETSPEVARVKCRECGAWERADVNGGLLRHSKRCESRPQPTPARPVVVREPVQEYSVEGYATHDREEAHGLAGLPPLTGSEKQVRWATEIRARLAPQIEQRIASLVAEAAPERAARAAGNTALRESLAVAAEELAYLRAFLASASAGLWIDHRTTSARDIWRARTPGTASKYGLPT